MSAEASLRDVVGSALPTLSRGSQESENVSGRRAPDKLFAVITIVGSALYLYLNLFTLTGTPFLLDGDQVYFWTYASRLLHGERIYQDFFTMHPPGASLFYAAMFGLFGARIWVTNLVVLVLGVMLCWICFRITDRFMERGRAALATGLFLVPVYGKLLNGTHHWFSVLAVMGAVALIISGCESWRIGGAGVLLGMASFFTQTRGPFALLGLSLYLLWQGLRSRESWQRHVRTQTLLCLSFFAALALFYFPYIVTTGAAKLWFFQIAYVGEHNVTGLGTASLGLPELPTWRRLPFLAYYLSLYVLLPVVYALSLYRCSRTTDDGATRASWRPVALLSLIGICLFAEVSFNVNWLRVFVVSMPGLILLIWIVSGAGKQRRYAAVLLWAAVIGLAVAQTWARHTHRAVMVLPAGQASVRPETVEKLDWIAQRTKPQEFFFSAAWPNLYLPLHLRNPVFLDLLERSTLTSPEYVQLSTQQLENKRTRYILWAPRLDIPDLFNGTEQYHLRIFRDYLRSHYHRVRSFADQDEVWERN